MALFRVPPAGYLRTLSDGKVTESRRSRHGGTGEHQERRAKKGAKSCASPRTTLTSDFMSDTFCGKRERTDLCRPPQADCVI